MPEDENKFKGFVENSLNEFECTSDEKQALKEMYEKVKDQTIEFHGKQWPVVWSQSFEEHEKLTKIVNELFKICEDGCIPMMLIVQEINVATIGQYNRATLVPRHRAGEAMHKLASIAGTFIGDGSITDQSEESLAGPVQELLANIAMTLFLATHHDLPQDVAAANLNKYFADLLKYLDWSYSPDNNKSDEEEEKEDDRPES